MNITTLVLCLSSIAQQATAALFYDRLFYVLIENTYLWVFADFASLIGAAYVLYPLLKEELREVKVINQKYLK